MNDKLITLVTVLEEIRDTDGFLTKEKTVETEIFADTKSVGATEYYAALRNDMEVKIIFVTDPDNFKLSERKIEVEGKIKKVIATRVVYDDTVYQIQRTYLNKQGRLEMSCREVE